MHFRTIFQIQFYCNEARWRENRTIFNTPNPRLMNVSLLRDNKLLHGQERRGSRMSVRLPSRQPSMASLRPHSPNASIGKLGLYAGNRFPFHFYYTTMLMLNTPSTYSSY
ncbi:AAEL012396-PA [Aedes aegypti]|uniref:AAEL012396-PA n=1 Tax=Aedes aegypti TaxID=7159 RepID=Q16M85_AEDAE|nr:AAEL012396-PA [Aedes aegypti]